MSGTSRTYTVIWTNKSGTHSSVFRKSEQALKLAHNVQSNRVVIEITRQNEMVFTPSETKH